MFVCRIFLRPKGTGSAYEQDVAVRLHDLARVFSEFFPRIEEKNHFVEFAHVDKTTLASIQSILRSESSYDLIVEERCSDADIATARYVPLLIEGEEVDSERYSQHPGEFGPPMCPACGLPDENVVPTPYFVSKRKMKRSQDIFWASNGIIIVSKRLAENIRAQFGAWLDVGDVAICETMSAKLAVGDYYWMRPKYKLGRELRSEIMRTCVTCGRPTQIRKVELIDKFSNARCLVEHFGSTAAEIALSGNWYGLRTKERPMSIGRQVFISPNCYAFLKQLGTKGLSRPTQSVVTADLVG